MVFPISHLSDTVISHKVNWQGDEITAFIEISCLIPATVRNVEDRLRWWSRLLVEFDGARARSGSS